MISSDLKNQDEIAAKKAALLKSMQESIRTELSRFMEEEGIGINELTRRLQTSSRQTSRIMKGEANITIGTLAEIAITMGVNLRIVFEK